MRTRKRNTAAYTLMVWTSFAAAVIAEFVGLYTLEEPLSVQGYYAVTAILLIMSSFSLQKVIRDNQEDDFNGVKQRNTPAYTFLIWASFVLAAGFEFIGIVNLKQPLSVQGYYAVTGAFLIMSSFALQKTIRDNYEDEARIQSEQLEAAIASPVTPNSTHKKKESIQDQTDLLA
jgi:hypothetical protein